MKTKTPKTTKTLTVKEITRLIRTAAIHTCLKNGINDRLIVASILRGAGNTVKPMSIAGVKASCTKGQNMPVLCGFTGPCRKANIPQ